MLGFVISVITCIPNSRMGHGDCLYGLLRFEHTYGIWICTRFGSEAGIESV